MVTYVRKELLNRGANTSACFTKIDGVAATTNYLAVVTAFLLVIIDEDFCSPLVLTTAYTAWRRAVLKGCVRSVIGRTEYFLPGLSLLFLSIIFGAFFLQLYQRPFG